MKFTAIKARLLGLVLTSNLFAQNLDHVEQHAHGFGIGYDVGALANGLAYGLRIASPAFLNNSLRVTLNGHMAWVQNAIPVGETTTQWLPYYQVKPGLNAGYFIYGLPIRLTGNIEMPIVIPFGSAITNKKALVGLTGTSDLELFVDPYQHHAFALTMGGQWLYNSRASGLIGSPTFGNGFLAAFGYRWYF